MNLIEQLGGYEKAKEELNWIKTYMWASKEMWMLEKELLQYRRENNIYEIGDKFFMLKIDHNDILTVTHEYLNDPSWNTRIIRHATNEEIKVGHRINKHELEELNMIDVSPCCKKIGDCDE